MIAADMMIRHYCLMLTMITYTHQAATFYMSYLPDAHTATATPGTAGTATATATTAVTATTTTADTTTATADTVTAATAIASVFTVTAVGTGTAY